VLAKESAFPDVNKRTDPSNFGISALTCGWHSSTSVVIVTGYAGAVPISTASRLTSKHGISIGEVVRAIVSISVSRHEVAVTGWASARNSGVSPRGGHADGPREAGRMVAC